MTHTRDIKNLIAARNVHNDENMIKLILHYVTGKILCYKEICRVLYLLMANFGNFGEIPK